jgi:hypothetical protein
VLGSYTAPDGLTALLPPNFRGTVILERHFNRPTGLNERSRVDLVAEVSFGGHWELNGAPLGPLSSCQQRASANAYLRLSNRLGIALVIDGELPIDQPIVDVRLEIFDGDACNDS